MSQLGFLDQSKTNVDVTSLSFEQKLDHLVIASVFREHIVECEKIIEHYYRYRSETFSEKIRHTNLLISKLKDIHNAELEKSPSLQPDLMYETRISSLENARDMLSECLFPNLKKAYNTLRPAL